MADEFILELKNITKVFHNTIKANNRVNLSIKRGEIHALLGENGAGKSTMMNIISGLVIPDEGDIILNGEKANIRDPQDAIALGIGMVHQHFQLVDTLTVAENILMGCEGVPFFMKRSQSIKSLAGVSNKFNLPIQPEKKVSSLSPGEKQRVEIVKMLYRDVDLLILDEPTSVLTPQESQQLFRNLEIMRENGKTVLFISHKLKEVMQIADRVSVLRRGELITTIDAARTSTQELANLMIGRDIRENVRKETPVSNYDNEDVVIKVDDISAVGEQGELQLNHLSLEIHKGEILGIAGVSGNGQSQLAECLTGLQKTTEGTISIAGNDLTNKNPLVFIESGVSHIPEDRINVGCIANFSCYENIISKAYRRAPIRRHGFIKKKEVEKYGEELMEKFDVRSPSPHLPVKFLSGGNIQKLIFAREFMEKPVAIIAMHPTYGLDVSAVENVHDMLFEQQRGGCSVLLISEDLDELLELSDRIAVIFKGKLVDVRDNKEWTLDELGLAMMGALDSDTAKGGGTYVTN